MWLGIMKKLVFWLADHVFSVYHPGGTVDCKHVDCHDGEHIPQSSRNREGMDPTGWYNEEDESLVFIKQF